MEMDSVWSQTAVLPHFEALKGDVNTDVLIIGGGMAGILCAHMLNKAGVDYVLAEAKEICGGITQNTTAKITSQHGLIYQDLTRMFGMEKARLYLQANEQALDEYRRLCCDVDCEFEEREAFVYTLNDRAKPEAEVKALEAIGYPAKFCERPALPISVAGAVRFPRQAQFHPLKFAAAISKDLKIFEHTEIRELEGTTAVTEHGNIRAKKIIVATHFPFINKHGGYFLKLYQHRSYVIALENAPAMDGMYVDASGTGLSFRNYGNLLLLGGASHRTGKTSGGWKELETFAAGHYPKSTVQYRWATQDCMTLDGVPYIGAYSKSTPDLLVATGFNKWGMTSSMVAAQILTDAVLGKENPYASVFDPSRTMLRAQLAVNAFEAVRNIVTPTKPRCPHLGCALKWNAQERTWDCPCHGSRFSRDGDLIDNPATGDMKKTK